MQTICCMCHRTKEHDGREAVFDSPTPPSHGYCPECFNKTMERIQQFFKQPRDREARACMETQGW